MLDNFQIDAKPYLLENTVQNYAWGTKGQDAYIPKLLGFEPELDKAYAELWMGAHPSAPSKIKIKNDYISLEHVIEKYPNEILGTRVAEKYGSLPFLLKVLSAGGPLSIQAHPSKEQAQRLHIIDPINYPDANHKPEIAIVLDHLTALVGLKDEKNMAALFEKYPEISDYLAGSFNGEENKSDLSELSAGQIYIKYMNMSVHKPENFEDAVIGLKKRIQKKGDFNEVENLFIKMSEKYGPRDVGLFALFFLNLLHLKKGEAVYLSTGVPHAYVRGNIVECMANSDNVVRAGLTPKFTDVAHLLEIIDAEKQPEIQSPICINNRFSYHIGVDDFAIEKLLLANGDSINEIVDSVQVLILMEGIVKLTWDNGYGTTIINKGETVVLPAILKNYNMSAGIKSTMFLARVP